MVAAITLTPNNGAVGTVVTVDGTGFTPAGTVTINYDGVPMTTTPTPITVGGGGDFSATFVVPASVQGAHTVLADDTVLSDSDTFTVNSQIVITEATGTFGDTINVIGTGYATVSAMSFTLDAVAIVPVGGAISSNATGGFTTTFLIPEVPNSTRTMVGTDGSANNDSDTIDIIAICIITEASAVYGDVITVVGHGYEATSAVTTTLNGVSITAIGGAFSTGATGGFNKTFTIPDVANGTRTFVAADAGVGTDSDTIVIDALITLDDGSGSIGESVVISGHGFTASSLMAFTFGGSVIVVDEAPLSSGSTGAFTGTITVPTGFDDTVSIVATDASAKTDSINFIIISISITEITVNSSFNHLNGINLNNEDVGVGDSVERSAVVDIPFGASDVYTTGGIQMYFSGIQGFSQVYLCKIIHNTVGLECSFIPGASNDSDLGKIKFWGTDGNELADNSSSISSKTLTVEIRGI